LLPHPGQCPLTDEAAEITEVKDTDSLLVNCPTCTTYLITYMLSDKLKTDSEAAKLYLAHSAVVRRHFIETKEPLHITEENFPARAMWKD